MTDQPEGGASQSGTSQSGATRKVSHAAAARILAARDPVIARLLTETGPPRLSRPAESHFGALVRAIVYQQLAGRAAAAIHGRLIARELRPLGDPFRPYRSVAAWYCWRAAELYADAAGSALTGSKSSRTRS